jgi:signal transduction histidine kinase
LIYTESGRLGQLINSMLDLSRIEAGQLSIQHNPVDLNALTARVVEAQQITLQRHTLTYSAPDGPVIISGDELRLEQVLQNLVQNAIKYSPKGGPVSVKLERREQGVALSISDRGIGIPQDTIPRLFSRFFRADNVKAYQISGLGIGLFVVKQIVNLHGGRIEVASRDGEGSTFTVYLPLEAVALAADNHEVPSAD